MIFHVKLHTVTSLGFHFLYTMKNFYIYITPFPLERIHPPGPPLHITSISPPTPHPPIKRSPDIFYPTPSPSGRIPALSLGGTSSLISPPRSPTSATRPCLPSTPPRPRTSTSTSGRSLSTAATSAWASASSRSSKPTPTRASSSPSGPVSRLRERQLFNLLFYYYYYHCYF